MPTNEGPARAAGPTSPSSDHAVDHHAPRWPRLVVVRALLPLGIGGALALSAAATVDMAARNHVPGLVQPAAVGMVEVVLLAGTLLAIFGTQEGTRNRGMIAVAGLGLVQLIAGAKAYGWFGLIAPIAAVYLVHLAAEAWQELRRDAAGSSTTSTAPATVPTAQLAEPLTSDEEPEAPAVEPVLDEPVPEVPDHVADRPTDEPTGPVEGPVSLAEWAADVRRRGVGDRALARELDVTRHHARALVIRAENGLEEVSA